MLNYSVIFKTRGSKWHMFHLRKTLYFNRNYTFTFLSLTLFICLSLFA